MLMLIFNIQSFYIFSKSITANMPNSILALLLLCIFLLSQFHSSYSNVTCIETERRALLEFKASLVDYAGRLDSWTTTQDCCSWDGITCNHRTGRVEKLDLHSPTDIYFDSYDNDISKFGHCCISCVGGEINPSLLDLEHLSYLDLSCNDFSGIQIPKFLGSLKILRYLNLSDSRFVGEIPPHLGNLSYLQHLSLGGPIGIFDNYITAKSLKWITGLTSLKVLDLSGTNMANSLDWLYSISMLPSLSSLNLRNCELMGTVSPPLSLVNLTSLVSLDLSRTDLDSNILLPLLNLTSHLTVLRLDHKLLQCPILIMLEKLTTLTVLHLSFNIFNSSSVLLHSLCNLTNLISLNLVHDDLQGSLPVCLGNLTSLRELVLAFNKFGGDIPSELGHLKQLITLDLSNNYFNASIPSNFGYLTNLEVLHLENNNLSSTVPSTLGQLTKLQKLDISHNLFTGTVPSTLGQLSKLQKLDISYNSFAGELFESHFAKLESLKFFSISNNYFLSFIVSSQWVPPFQLQVIHMDSVLLGPQFPPWLQTQTNVSELSMNNASISGTLPVWFSTFCFSIQLLHLSNNNIHGSLISFRPNLSIDSLDLHNNHLTGNIPDHLCNLSSLAVLSLANNQLTGKIPPCLGNLLPLIVLDLANNSLSGHIPSTLGNLWQLLFLHLGKNKFYGGLPSSLKNLRSLETLDLGENQLMDTIPEWIGKEYLPNLRFLRLQTNNFYGDISIHLCQLSSLEVLNLAQNNLVGHIPHCVGNWSSMQSNDFSGSFISYSEYTETLSNIMKGVELEYSSNLLYVKLISLSGNNLSGEIPSELLNLEGLQSLNLSNNKLSGRIPKNIGNLRNLESLDLSMNQLSGAIPQSLATIDYLESLNLSFNNLVGRIPSGNHFDTFDNQSIYEGNSGLCGKPLEKSCPGDTPEYKGKGHSFYQNIDDELELSWLSAGIAPGFAVGLLGVLCILYFKKSWRIAYFRFLENIYNTVWVAFAMKISPFLKKFN